MASHSGRHQAERDLLTHAVSRADPLHADELARRWPAIDWPYFLALSERNRVMATVAAALRSADLPADVAAVLTRARTLAAVDGQRGAAHLAEVVAALSAAGVRSLAFKGPTLAITAYGHLGRRHYNDLDLLVAPADRAAAERTLAELGFSARDDFGWAVSLVDDDGVRCVDLHTNLLAPEYRHGLDIDRAWAARETVTLDGGDVTTFGPAHRVVVAALQVAKDGMENRLLLQKVADVAAVCRSLPPEAWTEVEREATATRLRKLTATAIQVAVLAGCDIGPHAPVATDPEVDREAAAMLQRLWDEDIEYPRPFELTQRHRRLREDRRDGLRPYLDRAIAPDPATDPAAPLPRRAVDRLLRPLRLVARYGRRLRG